MIFFYIFFKFTAWHIFHLAAYYAYVNDFILLYDSFYLNDIRYVKKYIQLELLAPKDNREKKVHL